jgi:hypothetical protein
MASRDPRFASDLAVAIRALLPQTRHMTSQRIFALRKQGSQRVPVACKQTGIELAIGGDPRAVAITTERRTDRTHESNFADPIDIGMPRGDFTGVIRIERTSREGTTRSRDQPLQVPTSMYSMKRKR